MSGIRRQFTGWDEPLCRKVCRFLFPDGVQSTPDLESQLVIAPTRQAGRRLREAVALYGTESGIEIPVLGLRVVPPTFFLLSPSPIPESSPSLVKTTWAAVLQAADLSALSGLFPTDTPHREGLWALRLGETIQSLRESLAEGGYSIAEALARHSGQIEELDRWRDLATVEKIYLEAMARTGREDPCCRRIRMSADPELPDGVRRIVVAAVSDPTLLMTRALERLAETTDVVILVYAPPSRQDDFDAWGRPLHTAWTQALLSVPDAKANILLAASPADQSRRAGETIAAEIGASISGPADIGIGVPDPAVVPFLKADLAERDIAVFDPAGRPVLGTPTGSLLLLLRDLGQADDFPAFCSLVRHPDVLEYLRQAHGLRPYDVLTALDDHQKKHLPVNWRPSRTAVGDESTIACITAGIERLCSPFSTMRLAAALRAVLSGLYGHRSISSNRPEDVEFAETASVLNELLHEIETTASANNAVDSDAAFDLLLRRLEDARYEPEKPANAVDLEGWLELPWNDAPLLIVTGMNEGFVPDSRSADLFLPDPLRRALGLRDDQTRFARDIYLAQSLLEWRGSQQPQGPGGRVVFIAGRAGAEGDPLKPSRLLFRCPDSELLERAKTLFAEPRENRETVPLEIGMRLDPGPPADLSRDRLPVALLHVTAFRSYLECPFRFYLRHVLKMESLDTAKNALDAMDFGTLVHAAWRSMAEDPAMVASRDPDAIADFLARQAAAEARRQYGDPLPLLIQFQVEAAQKRLKAAARVQADLVAAGWEIVAREVKYDIRIGDMTVRGTVDRIDRHKENGRLRILDYKTSDQPKPPADTHLRSAREDTRDYAVVQLPAIGKGAPALKAWQDLQLPLYRRMVLACPEFASQECEIGYFNLPKSLDETRVECWESFTGDMAKAAELCAAGVVADIGANRFWPPSEKTRHDDFDRLFPAGAEACFDTTSFFGRPAP